MPHFAPRRNPRLEFQAFGADLHRAEPNPPSFFRKQESFGHRYSYETPAWEPGGRCRSALQPGMNREQKDVRHLCVGELRMCPSGGCMEYSSSDPECRGDTPGGDSEVEPGRKVGSKVTCPGDSAFCHLPLRTDFQQASDPQRE